jgi:hypothetical protein
MIEYFNKTYRVEIRRAEADPIQKYFDRLEDASQEIVRARAEDDGFERGAIFDLVGSKIFEIEVKQPDDF